MLYNDKQKIRDWIPPTTPFNSRAKLYVNSNHPINETEIKNLKADLVELVKRKQEPLQDAKIELVKEKIDAEQRRILANKEGVTSNIGKIPILAIPDSRFIDRSQTTVTNSKAASDDLKRDGALDFLYSNPFGPIISKGLFIVAQNNSTDFTKEPYNLIQRVISGLASQGGHMAFSSENLEIIKPFFKFSRVESTSTTGDYKIYVQSEEKNEEVLLNNISQGTFSILAVCLIIFRFLNELYPNSNNVLQETAIIIIDEIDAHLHPSWEQKIVGVLRKEFPNVQFIITAHSPLVVAGCLEGEVAVVRRTQNGFALEQNVENFIGDSTPELLNKVFEIEDRDDQFLTYSSLASQEDKIKQQINELENGKEKNKLPHDVEKLDKLYNSLNYIQKVKQVQSKQAEYSILETENMLLQQEVQLLKGKLLKDK